MAERRPIETAPRNGLSIVVGDPDCGEFVMHWNPTGTNPLVQPHDLGIWESTDRSFTWSERRGAGPTYWRHLANPPTPEGGVTG